MALKMQEELGDDLQVIFVESQNHPIDEVEQFGLNKKWFGGRAMWTTERPFDTGARGLPNCAVLGNEGQVLFSGSPTASHKDIVDLIAEQIKLAKKGSKELPASCTKALGEFDKGNYAAAIKSLEAVQDGPEKEAAKKLASSLTTRANARIARLAWLIENADFEQADKYAPLLASGVAGDEKLEAKVKELTTKLASQEMGKEREAAKALGRIEQRIEKDGLDPKQAASLVKSLNGVKEKFPNTGAAKRAEHLAKIAQMKPSS